MCGEESKELKGRRPPPANLGEQEACVHRELIELASVEECVHVGHGHGYEGAGSDVAGRVRRTTGEAGMLEAKGTKPPS